MALLFRKFLLGGLLLFCGLSYSQTFTNYSGSNGLPHKSVYCLDTDNEGYLWIGTSYGLCKFDGYTFTTFFPDESNPASINGGTIFDMKSGNDSTLWLLTDKATECFDKQSQSFLTLNLPIAGKKGYLTNLTKDNDGTVWTYFTGGPLFKLYKNNGALAYDSVTFPYSLFKDSLTKVYRVEMLNSELWIASSEGIFSYNLTTGKGQKLPIADSSFSYCHRIRKLDSTTLAFVFFHKGICLIDVATGTAQWINDLGAEDAASVLYTDVQRYDDHTIWLGTTSGINVYDQVDGRLVKHGASKTVQNINNVDVIHHDASGNMWVGTRENGLYVLNNHSVAVSKITATEAMPFRASSIAPFADGSLLVTSGNNCYRTQSVDDLFRQKLSIVKSGYLPYLYPLDSTRCIVRVNDSVYLYHSQTQRLSFLKYTRSAQYASMAKDSILWLAGWDGNVSGIHLGTRKEFQIDLKNTGKEIRGVSALLSDSDNSLWIGIFGSGLLHVTDPTSDHKSLQFYHHESKDPSSLGGNMVTSVYQDSAQTIWVGTWGGGLSRFHKETATFSTYTTEDGLTSNVIEALIGDRNGNIWIASNGLTKFEPQATIFQHYGTADGVFDSYYVNACASSTDGTLFFGSNNGLLSIDPVSTVSETAIAKPVLTAFSIAGRKIATGDTIDGYVPIEQALAYTNAVELPYFLNSVAFEFACVHFQNQNNIVYQYKLEGVDEKWLQANDQRRASYSMLQPGTYQFLIKSSLTGREWSEERVLEIRIVPPWWKMWWFRLLIAVAMVSGFGLILVLRLRAMKRVNIRLEEMIDERTAELIRTNIVLNNRNEQMTEQQVVLEMKNSQLKDALDSKQELIRILGHDFKNPLSALISILELVKKEADGLNNQKLIEYAGLNLKNAMRLLNQMSTVIDWSRSQDNNIVAKPIEINIELLLNDAFALVKDVANHKDIKLSVQADYETNAFVDPNMMSTVFRNLLSNAIKFTPREGSVMAMVQETDECIEIRFIDTGIGIDSDKQEHLFTGADTHSTTYGTENEKGSGLGLSICKSFVDKNNGTIRFESTSGEGSVFTVSIPKGNKAATKIQELSFEPVAEESEKSSILIIDDNTEIVKTVVEVFGSAFTVHKAFDGREGLYLARNTVPDVILCDINLPGASGLDVCKSLKDNALTSHIPILLITSEADATIETQGYALGANDFIKKPLNIAGLRQKISALLEYKKKVAELAVQEHQADKDNLPMNYENKTVQKVIDFLHSNISDPSVTTETIVEYMGISRTQLWRILKNTTGKTAGEFIRDIRLERSTTLLKTGKYRISEVAFEVGYADPKYFTKCFTKHFGMNPTAYQEKMRSVQEA